MKQHASDLPTILQPASVNPPTPAVPAVPPMAFWTRASQPPKPRQAIIPGRVQEPSLSPKLEAPPVLGPSNLQPDESDIAAALALVDAQTVPKLPLPNASTNPVRIRGESGTEIASFQAPESGPVNLISLMAIPSATRQVEILKWLNSIPRSNSDGGTAMTSGRAPDNGEKSGGSSVASHDRTAAGTDAASGVPTASSVAGPATVGPMPSAGGTSDASRDSARKTSGGAGQQDRIAAANSPLAKSTVEGVNSGRPATPPGARLPDPAQNGGGLIRMTHPPNGNFEVVLLQSVTRDDLPEVDAALSGNPVWTVYLSVGDAREWLLEYCIPASVNSRVSSFMVNIDDPGVVSAPYPLSTVIPRMVAETRHSKNIVLHGLLSSAGILHEVKAVNTEDPLVHEVLPLLSLWQFRPALQDKAPVEVEVLLIIPPHT